MPSWLLSHLESGNKISWEAEIDGIGHYASVSYTQGKFSVRKLWLNLTDLNLMYTNMQRKHTEIYLV